MYLLKVLLVYFMSHCPTRWLVTSDHCLKNSMPPSRQKTREKSLWIQAKLTGHNIKLEGESHPVLSVTQSKACLSRCQSDENCKLSGLWGQLKQQDLQYLCLCSTLWFSSWQKTTPQKSETDWQDTMASYNNSQRSSSNLKVFSYKFKVQKIPFRKDKESLLPPSLNWTLNRDMGVGLVIHWSLLAWSEVLGSQLLSLEQTRSPNHPILFTKTVGKKTFTTSENF